MFEFENIKCIAYWIQLDDLQNQGSLGHLRLLNVKQSLLSAVWHPKLSKRAIFCTFENKHCQKAPSIGFWNQNLWKELFWPLNTLNLKPLRHIQNGWTLLNIWNRFLLLFILLTRVTLQKPSEATYAHCDSPTSPKIHNVQHMISSLFVSLCIFLFINLSSFTCYPPQNFPYLLYMTVISSWRCSISRNILMTLSFLIRYGVSLGMIRVYLW